MPNTYGDAGTVYIEKNGIITYNFPYKDKKDIVIKERFTRTEYDPNTLRTAFS